MRYVWHNGDFIPAGKYHRPVSHARSTLATPHIMSDTPAYLSPTGSGMIDGRRARREDLKRSGCREVDPSERIDTTPKSAEQLAGEQAYMKARESQPGIDPKVAERLMAG